jgi:hypothetical protein
LRSTLVVGAKEVGCVTWLPREAFFRRGLTQMLTGSQCSRKPRVASEEAGAFIHSFMPEARDVSSRNSLLGLGGGHRSFLAFMSSFRLHKFRSSLLEGTAHWLLGEAAGFVCCVPGSTRLTCARNSHCFVSTPLILIVWCQSNDRRLVLCH